MLITGKVISHLREGENEEQARQRLLEQVLQAEISANFSGNPRVHLSVVEDNEDASIDSLIAKLLEIREQQGNIKVGTFLGTECFSEIADFMVKTPSSKVVSSDGDGIKLTSNEEPVLDIRFLDETSFSSLQPNL